MSFLNSLLLTLIKALHTFINNYALTIIVFTILIKLVVMPLNLKSRRSTMRMSTISPRRPPFRPNTRMIRRSSTRSSRSCIAKRASTRWLLPADAHFNGHPLRDVLRAAHVRERAAGVSVPHLLPQPGN